MAKRFVFTGKQSFVCEDFSPAALAADEVAVKNDYSLMSTGTENIVFNRLFDSGTHWDNWVKYPFYPGYAAVGKIVAVGDNVKSVAPGDRVAHRGNHASEAVCKEEEISKVPEGIDAKDAIWFALAKITFMGAKAANYFLGNTVLIIGAGPIGQMSIRWARAAGVSKIIVVDMVPKRLEIAKDGGADVAINQPLSDELLDPIKEECRGELPEIVIDTTGSAPVFQEALKFAKNKGKVIVLGDTGTPTSQCLSSDVINRGLQIIGAHDCHTDEEWTSERIHQLFFSLLNTGRFPMEKLNTHTFGPDNGSEAYKIANENRGETMGIVFNWQAS